MISGGRVHTSVHLQTHLSKAAGQKAACLAAKIAQSTIAHSNWLYSGMHCPAKLFVFSAKQLIAFKAGFTYMVHRDGAQL